MFPIKPLDENDSWTDTALPEWRHSGCVFDISGVSKLPPNLILSLSVSLDESPESSESSRSSDLSGPVTGCWWSGVNETGPPHQVEVNVSIADGVNMTRPAHLSLPAMVGYMALTSTRASTRCDKRTLVWYQVWLGVA